MALKALDIFKLTPKKNCKECGFPTCMAFSMKVASGAVEVSACPKMAPEALAKLAAATAPPMKTLKVGAGASEYDLGGETVLFRHEKTLVSRNRYAVKFCDCMDAAAVDAKLANMKAVEYERIGEIMKAEMAYVKYNGNKDNFLAVINQIKDSDVECAFVLEVADADVAKEAVAALAGLKPVVIGANKDNFAAMIDVVKADNLVLGVQGANLEELYTTVQAMEAADYKELIIDVTAENVKDTFVNAVQVRRIALKEGDRSFGYPSFIDVAKLADGDVNMEIALSSVFTIKYGSITTVDDMTYAKALPLYALRQNIYTDPQKPMRVEAKVYPLNNPDKNSPVLCSVDFALTYFTITGDIEASKVPCWLMIPDAGGYSVLTAWSAGKFGGSVIGAFAKECNIESYTDCRDIIIPGKLAVIQADVADNMPGWNVIIGTQESMEIPKFLKEYAANH